MSISLKESVSVGLQDFWSRKIRSIVTIMGIVLGTMSIIVVLSLVKGVNKNAMQFMMESGGLKRIDVNANWEYDNPRKLKKYFEWSEFEFLMSQLPEAENFDAKIWSWNQLFFDQKQRWGQVLGSLPGMTKVEEWDVESGRFIKDYDVQQANNVIVIGSAIKESLFGNKNPIGEYVTMRNQRFMVIGVMKHRFMKSMGPNFGNENQLSYLNRRAFIPLSTMIKRVSSNSRINSFSVRVKDPSQSLLVQDKLDDLLLNLRQGEPIFRIESNKEKAESMKKNFKYFYIISFILSGISLIVGGIVIMNIMLATIQERTREIGIRLAVGARRRDVFTQFLVQTVLITTIGGIIGVVLGFFIKNVVSNFIKIEAITDPYMVIVSVSVSAGVGLFFGIIPAIRASNLDPVKALRYE
jgi:putative ABC transport system permease protein